MPLEKILLDGTETGASSGIKINKAFDVIDLHKVVGNAHNPAHSYKGGDIVSHSELAYVAKHDVPPKPFSVVDWVIVGTGVPMTEIGGIIWNGSTLYTRGVIVTYNKIIYTARRDSNGMPPDVSPLDWRIPVTDCGNF